MAVIYFDEVPRRGWGSLGHFGEVEIVKNARVKKKNNPVENG